MMKRGWCPSLYEPMQAADGWLVRVKPSYATISADHAQSLAKAASEFGNGAIELTNRANLQFRGLTTESVHDFVEVVDSLGLAATNPDAERRRNLLVSPLTGPHPLALELEQMLMAPEFAALPSKFGLTLNTGGPFPVHDAPGDILIHLHERAALLSIDRSELAASVATAEIVPATSRLIRSMLDHGAARMRDTDAKAIFAAAGLTISLSPSCPPRQNAVGPSPGGFGIGVAFGELNAAALSELAALARTGDGTLRLTPWRCVLLPGVTNPIWTNPMLIGNPADPVLQIEACIGMPSCTQASVTTRADARRLAGRTQGRALHVSGCTKGCAHHEAGFTLVGEAGRYNLVRHGRADGPPQQFGLSIDAIEALLESAS